MQYSVGEGAPAIKSDAPRGNFFVLEREQIQKAGAVGARKFDKAGRISAVSIPGARYKRGRLLFLFAVENRDVL